MAVDRRDRDADPEFVDVGLLDLPRTSATATNRVTRAPAPCAVVRPAADERPRDNC
jgi:hypothetical protein